jgi:hypothetical protein
LKALADIEDAQATLNLATIAESLVKDGRRVAANDDIEYCKAVVKDYPRLYSPWLDTHDHMSTGRIMTDMGMMRILAAEKPQLEKMLNRDISH